MRTVLTISLMLLLFSCTDGLKRLPSDDNLLDRETMVKVTKDMVKLESFVQMNYNNVAEYHKVMITSGDSVLKSHKVSREQFTASMEYYGSRQLEMQEIYSEILDDLNKELAELQSK